MDSEKGSSRRPDTVYRSTGATPEALVCCGVVAMVSLIAAVSGVAVLAGAVGTVLFAPIACEMAWAVWRRRPELVIGDEAIEHLSFGRIAWSSVDHVRVSRDGRERVLEIVLRGGSVRACPRVPVRALPVRVQAVVGAIGHHRPEVLVGAERVERQANALGRTLSRGSVVAAEPSQSMSPSATSARAITATVREGHRRRTGLRAAIRRRPARPARPGNR
ncbi:hypothetical protein IU449_03055 [Nocardia higoensis]|uniref:PH domain-containing protein n=1 Tax=Nocardia higoensis TaxID=228599 RepID=A0ABS0D4X5_9NOCA|nr:hypothetical protein [Nocardia higoensis]MBF6353536.1 hypothetical protein [Nocardia higoensis]